MQLSSKKIVGLTGGIGSGKSEVRRIFESLGVPCIDADIVARNIHQNATHPALKEIKQHFPKLITPDGKLCRGCLRTLFARDTAANTLIKSILKPFVLTDMIYWTRQQTSPYVIWESAMVIEEIIPVDRILLIDAPQDIRRDRIRLRNPDWTESDIDNIFALQMQQFPPRKRPTIHGIEYDIISNETDLEQVAQEINALHNRYTRLFKG